MWDGISAKNAGPLGCEQPDRNELKGVQYVSLRQTAESLIKELEPGGILGMARPRWINEQHG